jgi:hypothetical protein
VVEYLPTKHKALVQTPVHGSGSIEGREVLKDFPRVTKFVSERARLSSQSCDFQPLRGGLGGLLLHNRSTENGKFPFI